MIIRGARPHSRSWPGMRPQTTTAVGCPGKASRPAPFTTPRPIQPEGRPMTKLQRLYAEYGQSPGSTTSPAATCATATLARMVADGIRGVTANPTIFAKAIEGSADYDEQFARADRGRRPGRGRLLGAGRRRHHRRARASCARSTTPAAAPTASCRSRSPPSWPTTPRPRSPPPASCTSGSTGPTCS